MPRVFLRDIIEDFRFEDPYETHTINMCLCEI